MPVGFYLQQMQLACIRHRAINLRKSVAHLQALSPFLLLQERNFGFNTRQRAGKYHSQANDHIFSTTHAAERALPSQILVDHNAGTRVSDLKLRGIPTLRGDVAAYVSCQPCTHLYYPLYLRCASSSEFRTSQYNGFAAKLLILC